jgi:hypothetical protein
MVMMKMMGNMCGMDFFKTCPLVLFASEVLFEFTNKEYVYFAASAG